MKTVITSTTAALIFVAVMGRAATAQGSIPFAPSVYVGGTLATGQATNSRAPGFTAGAGLDVGAARAVFLRAEASYTRFPTTDDPTEASDVSGRINVVLAEHTSILAFTPYAVGGIGVYHVRYSQSQGDYEVYASAPAATSAAASTQSFDESSGDDPSGNKFGWNAGAGVEIPGGAIASRLELRYHRVSTIAGSRNAYLVLSLGMRLVRL